MGGLTAKIRESIVREFRRDGETFGRLVAERRDPVDGTYRKLALRAVNHRLAFSQRALRQLIGQIGGVTGLDLREDGDVALVRLLAAAMTPSERAQVFRALMNADRTHHPWGGAMNLTGLLSAIAVASPDQRISLLANSNLTRIQRLVESPYNWYLLAQVAESLPEETVASLTARADQYFSGGLDDQVNGIYVLRAKDPSAMVHAMFLAGQQEVRSQNPLVDFLVVVPDALTKEQRGIFLTEAAGLGAELSSPLARVVLKLEWFESEQPPSHRASGDTREARVTRGVVPPGR